MNAEFSSRYGKKVVVFLYCNFLPINLVSPKLQSSASFLQKSAPHCETSLGALYFEVEEEEKKSQRPAGFEPATSIAALSFNNFIFQQMAYLFVLKICKLLFTVAGHSLVHMVADACQPESPATVTPALHNQVIP